MKWTLGPEVQGDMCHRRGDILCLSPKARWAPPSPFGEQNGSRPVEQEPRNPDCHLPLPAAPSPSLPRRRKSTWKKWGSRRCSCWGSSGSLAQRLLIPRAAEASARNTISEGLLETFSEDAGRERIVLFLQKTVTTWFFFLPQAPGSRHPPFPFPPPPGTGS